MPSSRKASDALLAAENDLYVCPATTPAGIALEVGRTGRVLLAGLRGMSLEFGALGLYRHSGGPEAPGRAELIAPLDGTNAPSLPSSDDTDILSLAQIVWREGASLDAGAVIDDKTFNQSCDRLNRMRDQILAIPARTPAGAAAELRIGLWPDLLSSDGAAVDPAANWTRANAWCSASSRLDAMAAAQGGAS